MADEITTIAYAPLTESEIFYNMLLEKRDLVSAGLKWTSESDADYGIALMRVIAHGLALGTRYTDNRATQGYLIYAIDDEAVHGGCRGIGYKIRGPVASTILLTVTASGAATLPAGTKVVKTNSSGTQIQFETISDLVFTSAGVKQVYAIQGVTYSITSTGDNTEYQTLMLPKYPVAYTSISVMVGGDLWTEVTDFINAGPDSKNYTVEYDYKGQAKIEFGDGQFGKKPTSGSSIIVAYRTCDGSQGNVAPGAMTLINSIPKISSVTNQAPAEGTLKAAVTANSTQVELEDDGTITSFASSGVAYINEDSFSYTSKSGNKFMGVTGLENAHGIGESVTYSNRYTIGLDRESNRKAKINALRNNRIKTSANSVTDYEFLARKVPGVARAKAVSSNNIVSIQVVPADAGIPTSQLINTTLSYLSLRKNARHTISVVQPKYVYIDVTVEVTSAASYSFNDDIKPTVLGEIQNFLHPLDMTDDELYYQNGWGRLVKKSVLIKNLMGLSNGMLLSDVNVTVFKKSSDTSGSSNINLADDEIAHVGVIRVINGDMQAVIEPGAGYGVSGVITMPKIAAVIG
jgi:hypothetical protein